MVERRKHMRAKASVVFPEALRAHLVAAAKAGATEALDEFASARASYFDGIEPAEHIQHHAGLRQSAKRWKWLEGILIAGAGDAIKRIVTVVLGLLTAALLLGLPFPAVRKMLAAMLGDGG